MTSKSWTELRPLFKLFAKTIKPWRATAKPEGTYADGWNDSLAATKKAEGAWFRNMDREMKTKIIPIRWAPR